MEREILNEIKRRGLLLEKEVFEVVDQLGDSGKALEFIGYLEEISGQKFITKSLLSKNFNFVRKVINDLPGENRKGIEKVIVKLGLSLEIEKEEIEEIVENGIEINSSYEVCSSEADISKKLVVADFTNNFRARYLEMQNLLMARPELNNLVSINRISSDRRNFSIIGIVSEKRITKNGNYIIKVEDISGDVNALVKMDNVELFEKAEELMLDDVIGLKVSGSSEMVFVHEIFFPDCVKHDKIKFEEDVNIAFLSDIHCGSDRHLGKEFKNFLNWLNGSDEEAKKIRFIFFVGDNVDGVGIFPGQEEVLELKSMAEQYSQLVDYMHQIPESIQCFMCPGQHDASRVAEPQPKISRKYCGDLYEINNLVLVPNPCLIKLKEGEKEFKVLMYHGASIHGFINEIKELREMKAHGCPAKAVRHMLKRRHLGGSHGSVVYIPGQEKDPLSISVVPDVLCTGEVHRLDIDNYNGVLILTGSCWQSQTPFEEKIGNIPDPCKVPILNLKTRNIKVYDFSEVKNES
jgi:DNA polymerase II small subunit